MLIEKKCELIRQLEAAFSPLQVQYFIILNDVLSVEKEQKTSVRDDELNEENRRRNETVEEEKEQKTRVRDDELYEENRRRNNAAAKKCRDKSRDRSKAVADRAQKLKDGYISLNQLVDETVPDPFQKQLKFAVLMALDGPAPDATDHQVEAPNDASVVQSLQEKRNEAVKRCRKKKKILETALSKHVDELEDALLSLKKLVVDDIGDDIRLHLQRLSA